MDLYDRLLDMNNLYASAVKCEKGVNWKESVQRFDFNIFQNIYKIQNNLKNGTYKQRPFFEFDIYERGKNRHIKSLHISDRVLQRALCDYVLNPILFKKLIYDNGASVKGKGIAFTRKRLKVHLGRYYRQFGPTGYVLKIDYSKYFDNIPHDLFIEKVKKEIKNEKIITLLKDVISAFGGDIGFGIGSQLSQTAGIFYPTELDQFCKTVKGCHFYGRYMDDTYIIHKSKDFLKDLLTEYKEIAERLGIKLNEKKTQIIKLEKGFIFLQMKYRLTETGKVIVIPCRKSVIRERRKIKKLFKKVKNNELPISAIEEQYKSWRGNIVRFNSYKSVKNCDALYKSIMAEANYGRDRNEKRAD